MYKFQQQHFNSIKVRLEAICKKLRFFYIIFQFHKGAIGAYGATINNNLHVGFQFHKGAIGVLRKDLITIGDVNFNSIKVRLENCLIYFAANSHKISIP